MPLTLNPPPRDLILWDGDCGFCRQVIQQLLHAGASHHFDDLPYQEAPWPPMTQELYADCAEAMHVVGADGSILRGGDAVLYILERSGLCPPVRWLRRQPLLAGVEAAYRLVARNRPFFSRLLPGEISSADSTHASPMVQTWRHLLFLHWEIDADLLRTLVPEPLELDVYEGKAYVGLVTFTITGHRFAGLPQLPALSGFHEINVRTYVRGPDGGRGVYFFSLDATHPIMVAGARVLYSLPYCYARMSMRYGVPRPGSPADSRRGIWYRSDRLWPEPAAAGVRLWYRPLGPAGPAAPGSLEEFLIERYELFTVKNDTVGRVRVFHHPYQVSAVEVGPCHESLLTANGLRPAHDAPCLAHYARGVDVRLGRPELLVPGSLTTT